MMAITTSSSINVNAPNALDRHSPHKRPQSQEREGDYKRLLWEWRTAAAHPVARLMLRSCEAYLPVD